MNIACEKCGATQEGPVSLARHLRDDHGMTASQTIPLAKEINARYRDTAERIRQTAPDLLEACEIMLPDYQAQLERLYHAHGDTTQQRADLEERIRILSVAIAKARGA